MLYTLLLVSGLAYPISENPSPKHPVERYVTSAMESAADSDYGLWWRLREVQSLSKAVSDDPLVKTAHILGPSEQTAWFDDTDMPGRPQRNHKAVVC